MLDCAMYKHIARIMFAVMLAGGFSLTYGNIDPAFACSCAGPKPIQEAFEASAAVFSGRVTHIDADQFGRTAVFHVDTAWKGVSKDTVEVSTAAQSSACGYGFEEGKSYVVYAHSGSEESSLKVNSCGRTTPAENALEHFITLGAGHVPTETVVRDRVVVDSGIDNSLIALFGIGGALAAVFAYVMVRKRPS